MINVENVSKHYGDFVALNSVSFNINKGEIVGLLGPNGAGKTSLIRILAGYFEASSGRVSIDNLDVVQHQEKVQGLVGYMPENAPLYPEMLVQEYLSMITDYRQIAPVKRVSLLAEAIYATGLEDKLTKPIATLSKGYRQRVGLAQAIIHKPKVLILDEPTSGLDPTQVVLARDLIRRLSQNTTVLFSTHILSEVEQLCQRALVIVNGELKVDAHIDQLRSSQSARVAIATTQNAIDVQAKLQQLPNIQKIEKMDSTASNYQHFVIYSEHSDDLCRNIFKLATQSQWELAELSPMVRTLETVFNELVNPAFASKQSSSTKNTHASEVSQ